MAPNQTQPGRGKLNSYVSAAQKDIKEADQLISKAIRDKSSKPKDFTKKILSTINHVIPVLDAVADIHPAVGIVVSTFKQICKLETERAANDDRIVVMHYTASLSMFSLQHVGRLDTLDSMEQDFKRLLNKFDETLQAFGNFVSIYYNQKQSIVRLLQAGKYKKQLEEFSINFHDYRDELQNMVGMHTALKTDDIQAQLYNVDGKLDNILTGLEKTPSPKEREAVEIIAKNGAENIIGNEKLLREVASKLGEKLNGSVRAALREDISKQMADNQEQFSQKIEAAKESVEEAIKASRDAVILHLNQGPHELIKDDDIKAVWKNMKWRNSVKCRVFVDAIHDHYTDKFGKYLEEHGDVHEDHWTLQILSKVVFHSTIGDAIDEDSSGFVSVTEVNQFLERRPESWSVPEWLAFWGLGWSKSNSEYREKIHERLDEIKSDASDLAKKLDDDDDREALKEPISLISDFVEALVRSDDDDDDDGDDDLDDDGDELGRLQYEFEETQESQLSTKLKEVDIEAPPDIIAVIGQPRIELSLRPLLYVWLGKVQEQLQAYLSIIESGDAEDGDQNGDTKDNDGHGDFQDGDGGDDAEDFDETIGHIALIGYVVNNRLAELTRVWRQQRISPASQVLCFCGGVFSSWYEERENSESVLQRLLSSAYGDYWEDSDEDSDDPDDDQSDNEGAAPTIVTTKSTKAAARKKPLRGDVDQKLQQVWTRMDSFDDRLGTIETLLRSLIAASASTSPPIPMTPKKQLSPASQSQVPTPPATPASKGDTARATSSQVSQRHDPIDEEDEQDYDGEDHDQHFTRDADSQNDHNYHIAGDALPGLTRYGLDDEEEHEDGEEDDDERDNGHEADNRGRSYNPYENAGGGRNASHQYQDGEDEDEEDDDDDHAVQQRSGEGISDNDDDERESSENADSGSDGGFWPFSRHR